MPSPDPDEPAIQPRFEIRTLHRSGGEQPTLWCLNCDRRVRVVYRNEWGYVDQWKKRHLNHCPARERQPMTLEEIKAAVEAGKTVHWGNDSYTVVKDSLGQFLIGWRVGSSQENYIGLTWRDGITMNGEPEEFYLAP